MKPFKRESAATVSGPLAWLSSDSGILVDLRPMQRLSGGLNSIERQLLAHLQALKAGGPDRPQLVGYCSALLPKLTSLGGLFDRIVFNAYSGLRSGILVILDEGQALPALARTIDGGRMPVALVVDRRSLLPPGRSIAASLDVLLVPAVPGPASDEALARRWPAARIEPLAWREPFAPGEPLAIDPVERIALAQFQQGDSRYILLAPEIGARSRFAIGAARAEVMRTAGRAPRLLALRPNHLPPRLTPLASEMARSIVQFGDVVEVPSLGEAAVSVLVRNAAAVLLDDNVPFAEYGAADVLAWGGRPVRCDPALGRSEPAYLRSPRNPLVALMADVVEGRPVAIAADAPRGTAREEPAATLWSRLIGATAKAERRSGRRRLAMVAPYPAGGYGVPVYTRETGTALSTLADVDLFTTRAVDAFDRQGLHQVLDPRKLVDPLQYDEVIHILYNHPEAEPAYRSLMANGGAVILHDAQILDLLYHVMGPVGFRSYFDQVLNRRTTEDDFIRWVVRKRDLPSSFMDVIVEKVTTLIVHSASARDFLQKTYGIRSVYVPVAIQHGIPAAALTPAQRQEAKRICDMHPTRLAIGTFGTVQLVKGDKQYPFIVRDLLDWGHDIDFYFVGQAEPARREEIERLAARLGVSNRIRFVSDISEELYKTHLAAMDMGVQTRDIRGGQVSGALLDCVAASLPTIASAGIADAIEAPSSYVRRIDDVSSPLLIAHAIAAFLPELSTLTRPDPAWGPYVEDRTFSRYAERLCQAIFG